MNQTLVTNVFGKNVYLISTPNFSFYICIPNDGKGNIILNLVDDVNLISMNNTMASVTEEVTKIYNKFNFSDLAVVTPVFDSNLLEQVKLNNNSSQAFGYMDKYMGSLINSAYNFLSSKSIKVDDKIKLNNNPSYGDFCKWFVEKYKERVELVNYDNVPINKFSNTAESTVIKNEDSVLANNVLDNTAAMSTIDTSGSGGSSVPKEPGFVSYVLLGVIVAVLSLVVLYLLL